MLLPLLQKRPGSKPYLVHLLVVCCSSRPHDTPPCRTPPKGRHPRPLLLHPTDRALCQLAQLPHLWLRSVCCLASRNSDFSWTSMCKQVHPEPSTAPFKPSLMPREACLKETTAKRLPYPTALEGLPVFCKFRSTTNFAESLRGHCHNLCAGYEAVQRAASLSPP